jgi:hypothetical protein
MLQDIVERFRYRFELWRRERRADWRGATGERVSSSHQQKPEDSWESVAPKDRAILTDSTPLFVLRMLMAYLVILVILVLSCYLLGTFVPVLRHACSIASIIFAVVWTLTIVCGITQVYRQRRQYRVDHEHI